jgi:hypothetical protein
LYFGKRFSAKLFCGLREGRFVDFGGAVPGHDQFGYGLVLLREREPPALLIPAMTVAVQHHLPAFVVEILRDRAPFRLRAFLSHDCFVFAEIFPEKPARIGVKKSGLIYPGGNNLHWPVYITG